MQLVSGSMICMELSKVESLNPIEHARNIEDVLASLKSLCRHELEFFDGHPKARALLSTSAEVLEGLEKAFHSYLEEGEQDDEQPAQRSSDPWD